MMTRGARILEDVTRNSAQPIRLVMKPGDTCVGVCQESVRCNVSLVGNIDFRNRIARLHGDARHKTKDYGKRRWSGSTLAKKRKSVVLLRTSTRDAQCGWLVRCEVGHNKVGKECAKRATISNQVLDGISSGDKLHCTALHCT